MLEFQTLEIKNFLSFQHAKLDLRSRGLYRVLGENLDVAATDSNDAGKSNLFSAITWALFEKLAKRGDARVGDEVVNREAGSDCWVSIEWKEDGKLYRAVRYRKDSVMTDGVTLEGGTLGKIEGKRFATNEQIAAALGYSYSLFLRTAFWAQGSQTRRLTQLTDAEYKIIFDELINTEGYVVKSKAIAKYRAELCEKLDENRNKQRSLRGQLQAYESIDTKKIPTAKLSKLAEEKQALEARADKLRLDEAANTGELRRVARDQEKWSASIAKLQDKLRKHRTALDQGICPTCGQKLVSKDSTVHATANLEVETHWEIEAASKALYAANEEQQAIDNGNIVIQDQKDDLYVDEEAFEKKIAALPEDQRQIMGGSASIVLDRIERIKQQNREAEKIKTKMRDIRRQLEGLDKEEQKLLAELGLYDVLGRAFGPGGMRMMKLEELTPALNDRSQFYSEELTGGAIAVEFSTVARLKSGETRERYSVKARTANGVDFSLWGGGMMRRADLIAALALEDVRRDITGKRISLRVYDEATDGIDASGELALVQLLREVCKSELGFFVSHKSLVSDNLFDGSLAVRKRNGVSALVINGEVAA